MRKMTGLSLMVLILLSLCLLTLSLLSVSEAMTDRSLSIKSAEHTEQYYAADLAAKKILEDIDETLAGILRNAVKSNAPEEQFYRSLVNIKAIIPDVSLLSTVSTDKEASSDQYGVTLAFSVPVSENQVLTAMLMVSYPAKDNDTMMHILSWKTINTQEWEADISQKVLRLSTASNQATKEIKDE